MSPRVERRWCFSSFACSVTSRLLSLSLSNWRQIQLDKIQYRFLSSHSMAGKQFKAVPVRFTGISGSEGKLSLSTLEIKLNQI